MSVYVKNMWNLNVFEITDKKLSKKKWNELLVTDLGSDVVEKIDESKLFVWFSESKVFDGIRGLPQQITYDDYLIGIKTLFG